MDDLMPLMPWELFRDFFYSAEIEKLARLQQNVSLMNNQIFRNKSFLRGLLSTLFSKEEKKALTGKRAKLIKSIVFAVVVRQVILNEGILVPSEGELRAEVQHMVFDNPRIAPESAEEIKRMCRFMRVILTLHDMGIPGANNKHMYLLVGAMLEGSGKHYATGGSPSKATLRREAIFEKITNCPPRLRRVKKCEESSSSDKDFSEDSASSCDSSSLYAVFDDSLIFNPHVSV